MDYETFLTRVIDDGIAAAKESYADERHRPHLQGAVEGFESCRGLSPLALRDRYAEANQTAHLALLQRAEDYWRWRCAALEVEWVCNVVSAMFHNEGIEPVCGHLPTVRGMMKAADILGVRQQQ